VGEIRGCAPYGPLLSGDVIFREAGTSIENTTIQASFQQKRKEESTMEDCV
jgi:hypothetical protein